MISYVFLVESVCSFFFFIPLQSFSDVHDDMALNKTIRGSRESLLSEFPE